MNEPTIDEQIEWQKQLLRNHPQAEFKGNAILASLERLKRLDSQPVPVEPVGMHWLREAQALDCGYQLSSIDLDVLLNYIDALQSELRRVTEERDAKDRLLKDYEEWLSVQGEGSHQLLKRAEAAESLNKRLEELLQPLIKIADTNGAGWSEDEVNAMAKGIKAMSEQLLKEVE